MLPRCSAGRERPDRRGCGIGKCQLLMLSATPSACASRMARSGALRTAPGKKDRMSRGALALAKRAHVNGAVTALANKMARVAWAMLRHGTTYEPNGLAA